MRVVLFYHSLVSDWNHGNAHFLRGVASELQAHGHVVTVYEAKDAWSARNLAREHGEPARHFHPRGVLAAGAARLSIAFRDHHHRTEGGTSMSRLDIAFFGSSLLSAYRNGAATYYRGVLRALAGRAGIEAGCGKG